MRQRNRGTKLDTIRLDGSNGDGNKCRVSTITIAARDLYKLMKPYFDQEFDDDPPPTPKELARILKDLEECQDKMDEEDYAVFLSIKETKREPSKHALDLLAALYDRLVNEGR